MFVCLGHSSLASVSFNAYLMELTLLGEGVLSSEDVFTLGAKNGANVK